MKKINYIEFARKVKAEYPEYSDVDDKVLSQKMIAKYPQYGSQVDFGTDSGTKVQPAISAEDARELKRNMNTMQSFQNAMLNNPNRVLNKPLEVNPFPTKNNGKSNYFDKQPKGLDKAIRDNQTQYLSNPQNQARAHYDVIQKNPEQFTSPNPPNEAGNVTEYSLKDDKEYMDNLFSALPAQKQFQEWQKNKERWDDHPSIQPFKTVNHYQKGFWRTAAGNALEAINAGSASVLGGVSEFMHQNFEKPLYGWMWKGQDNRQIWGRIADVFHKDAEYSSSAANIGNTVDENGQIRQKDFIDYAKEGDWYRVLGHLTLSGLESAPTTATALFSALYGAPQVGLSIIGASVAGNRKRELDLNNPELNEFQKTLISVGSGAIEAGSEMLGSVPIGKMLGKLYMKGGTVVFDNVMKDSVDGIIKSATKDLRNASIFWKAPLEEGMEEFASGVGTYLLDSAFGLQKFDMGEMLRDAGVESVYGAFSGGMFGLAGSKGVARNRKIAKQIAEIKSDYDTAKEKMQTSLDGSGVEFDGEKMLTLPLDKQQQLLTTIYNSENLSSDQKNDIGNYLEAGNNLNTALVNMGLNNIEMLRKKAAAVKDINSRVNPETGTIDEITIQGTADTENYAVKSGNIAVTDEGTINLEESDQSIYYYTGNVNEDGSPEVQVISIQSIAKMNSENPHDVLKKTFTEIESEEFGRSQFGVGMKVAVKDTDGNPRLRPDGTPVIGSIYELTENGLNVMIDGEITEMPFAVAAETLEEVQSETERLDDADSLREGDMKNEREGDLDTDRMSWEVGDRSVDANGNEYVVSDKDADGNYYISDANGNMLDRVTAEEMPDWGFELESDLETGRDGAMDNERGGELESEQTDEDVAREEFMASLPRIEKGANAGEFDQSQFTPEQTIGYFEYEFGPDKTVAMVQQHVNNLQHNLKKEQAKLEQNPLNIAQNKKVTTLEAEIKTYSDYVKGIQRTKLAETVARNEERSRQNKVPKPSAEEIEAQRKAELAEAESVSGVPDILTDTAEKARTRGFRSVNGLRVERQPELTIDKHLPAERKFSDTNKVAVKRTLVEAEQIQPSHRNGQRNPKFFITEAQPKERTDKASQEAAIRIASQINPPEITGGTTAYTGSPIVNSRGEVLQGNNRTIGLQEMYQSYPESAQRYRQHLIEHADDYGMTAEEVAAMKHPIAVDIASVSDAEAIHLGQLNASDTESGGTQRIASQETAVGLGEHIGRFANMLYDSGTEDMSMGEVLEANGRRALEYLMQKGLINNTQYQSAFDERGNLTPEAKQDLKDITALALFNGANDNLKQMFRALPDKAQKAILQTLHRDANSNKGDSILNEIRQAIEAFYLLNSDEAFAASTTYSDLRIAAENARNQTQLFNSESNVPLQKYSTFAMELAVLFKSDNQNTLKNRFNSLYDSLQGLGGDMFNAAEKLKLADAIKKHFNSIDYVSNEQIQRADVAGDGTVGALGESRGTTTSDGGERSEESVQPTERGRGVDGANRYDNQGNPVDAEGNLVLEQIAAVSDLTDTDFISPYRNVQLPQLSQNVDDAIGVGGKPVVIKKNIFEKNGKTHSELSAEDSREIISQALYNPSLYGQNQKTKRPYNWILIHLSDKSNAIVLEVNENKENVEVVSWHYIDSHGIELKRKQALKEGGRILTLESAAGNTLENLSSNNKDNAGNLNNQINREKNEEILGLEDYTEEEIKNEAIYYVSQKLDEAGLDAEIVDLAIIGSRKRGDAKATSDLDIVLEFDGDISEDGMFNLLNDGSFSINGINVDINPITADKTGTLEEYLAKARKYDEKVSREQQTVSIAEVAIRVAEENRREELRTEVDRLSTEFNTPVVIHESTDTVSNAAKAQINKTRTPGWYEGGQVHIYLPDATSKADIQQTFFHETVAHKGLRELLGDGYGDVMLDFFGRLPNAVQEELLARYSGFDAYRGLAESKIKVIAADEFIALVAERGEFMNVDKRTVLQRIVDAIKDFFKRNSIGVQLADVEKLANDYLRQSADRLRRGGFESRRLGDKETGGREDMRYRAEIDVRRKETVEKINSEFNDQLEGITEENADRIILKLGRPSSVLLSANIPDREIALYANKLVKKAKEHGYHIENVKNLPKVIEDPIAVFEGSQKDSFALLTDLKINGLNTLAALDVKKGEVQDLTLVSTVYGKKGVGIVKWITDGKLLYVNKQKALNYLSSSAPIADATNNQGLNSAANIIENFENPSIGEENVPLFRTIGEIGASRAEGAEMILDNLRVAKEMQAAKKDAKAIRLATGWERSADGKWRYEVADEHIDGKLLYKTVLKNLGNIMPNSELLKLYPDLANVGVRFEDLPANNPGSLRTEKVGKADEARRVILLNKNYLDEINSLNIKNKEREIANYNQRLKEGYTEAQLEAAKLLGAELHSEEYLRNKIAENKAAIEKAYQELSDAVHPTLIHEIQHAIQQIEGFARGGNTVIAENYAKMQDRLTDYQRKFVENVDAYLTEKENGTLREDYTLSTFMRSMANTGEFGQDLAKDIYSMNDKDIMKDYNRLKPLSETKRQTTEQVYNRLAGEVEARNATTRKDFTPEQRRETLLSDTEDVAREEQIILFRALEESSSNSNNITEEIESIKQKAIADGIFMKAPNGEPTNLNERQWLQVRTKAFKDWFGDWEKAARIEKLRNSEPIELTGKEIEPSDDLKEYKKNALEYGKKLQGEYTNADTGITIKLQRGRKNGGINEVLQHDYKNIEHLQSIAAIPQIIKKAIYIDSQTNDSLRTNPDVKEYQYYVCGLKIGAEDYTVRAVVAVDSKGNRYYDHKLTNIEKGKLLDQINGQAIKNNGFGTMPDTKSTTNVYEYKDKKLISLLQTNSSKVVDENGEPMMVYHGTNAEFNTFKSTKFKTAGYFSKNKSFADKFSKVRNTNPSVKDVFLNITNPLNLSHIDGQKEYTPKELKELIPILKGKDIKWRIDRIQGWLGQDYVIDVIDSSGYNGVVFNEPNFDYSIVDAEGNYKKLDDELSYIAFESNQIKSATDNTGEFDPNNNDIRFRASSSEEESIKSRALADGTFMKAPNGKPTKLNEKQWLQVRTKAFKDWFGDWEKAARIEKLRNSEPIELTGNEYRGKYELNRDSAHRWILDNLRGNYRIKDTNETVLISRVSANEITSHGEREDIHLKSFAFIPQMLENAVFIDETDNYKNNKKYDSYRYYVVGLNVGGENYTARMVVGVKNGKIYYDHELTQIEKGNLIDSLNRTTTSVAENKNTSFGYKDKRLFSLLQTNSSKVVDENGEPMVVWHGTSEEFSVFGEKKAQSQGSYLKDRNGFFFAKKEVAELYGNGILIGAFLNIKNPNIQDVALNLSQLDYDYIEERAEAEEAGYPITRWLGEGDVEFEANDSATAYLDDNMQEIMDETDDYNNDGVIVYGADGSVTAVSFSPNQIKSATDNVGTFDSRNDAIRFRSEYYDVNVRNNRAQLTKAEAEYEALKQKRAAGKISKSAFEKQEALLTGTIARLKKSLEEYIAQHSENEYESEPVWDGKKPIGEWAQEKAEWNLQKSLRRGLKETANEQRGIAEGIGKGDVDTDQLELLRIALDERLGGWFGRFAEGWQDNIRSVRIFLDLMKEQGLKVSDFNDFYMQYTAIQGKNDAHLKDFGTRYMKFVNEQVNQILGKTKYSYRDVENYVMAKHGIERNNYMRAEAKRVAAEKGTKATLRDDYSGLYAIAAELYAAEKGIPFNPKKKGEVEKIQSMPNFKVQRNRVIGEFIQEFENTIEGLNDKDLSISSLWKAINAATHYSLDRLVQGGVESKKEIDDLKSRFKYYVPLRGHEIEAEKRWQYEAPDNKNVVSKAIVQAKGRSTRAEYPFAYMIQTAQTSINKANRNMLNQTMLRLARMDKTGMMSVSEGWYMLSGIDPITGKEIWTETEPEFVEDHAIRVEEISAWNEKMVELEAEGKAKRFRKGLDIGGLFIKPKQRKQHAISVYEDGVLYQVYINGNPRVAQAVNELSMEPEKIPWISPLTRFVSSMITSRSPQFMLTNGVRDFVFASTILPTKEGGKYMGQFLKNYPKAMALLANDATFKFGKEETKLKKYMKEFELNGGETGYSHLLELHDIQKKLEREQRGKNYYNPLTYGQMIIDVIDTSNSVIENATRLATYIASRENGRSIERSVSDSKEVTLNFNRRGTGAMGAAYVKPLWMFVNVGVQALTNIYNVGKINPLKMGSTIALYAGIGYLMPMIIKLIGGDEGEKEYWNLTDWERQNNFCFYTGNGFGKIPLPQEFRVFYKVGDLTHQLFTGRTDLAEATLEAIKAAADLIPVSPLGTIAGGEVKNIGDVMRVVMIDAFASPMEVATNTTFMGTRVYDGYKQQNKNIPGYQRARLNRVGEPRAPKPVYGFAKWLDYMTGGDGVKRGVISMNPDIANHLMRGYFGGIYNLLAEGEKSFSKRFYTPIKDLEERSSNYVRGYYDKVKESDEILRQAKAYKEQVRRGEIGVADFAKKVSEEDVMNARRVRSYKNKINKLEREIKSGELDDEHLQRMKHFSDSLKQEVVGF